MRHHTKNAQTTPRALRDYSQTSPQLTLFCLLILSLLLTSCDLGPSTANSSSSTSP